MVHINTSFHQKLKYRIINNYNIIMDHLITYLSPHLCDIIFSYSSRYIFLKHTKDNGIDYESAFADYRSRPVKELIELLSIDKNNWLIPKEFCNYTKINMVGESIKTKYVPYYNEVFIDFISHTKNKVDVHNDKKYGIQLNNKVIQLDDTNIINNKIVLYYYLHYILKGNSSSVTIDSHCCPNSKCYKHRYHIKGSLKLT